LGGTIIFFRPAAVLLAVGVFVLVEAVRRLFEPPSVASGLMIVFGVAGEAGGDRLRLTARLTARLAAGLRQEYLSARIRVRPEPWPAGG